MDTNTLLIVAAAILFMRMRQPSLVQVSGQRATGTTGTTGTTTPPKTTPTPTTDDKKDDKKDDDQPSWAKQANAAIGVATGLVGLGAKIAGEIGKYVK